MAVRGSPSSTGDERPVPSPPAAPEHDDPDDMPPSAARADASMAKDRAEAAAMAAARAAGVGVEERGLTRPRRDG